jgi:hypothetical protein
MRLSRFSLFLLALAMPLASVLVDAQNAPALAGRWEGTLIPRIQNASRDLSQRANRPKLPTVVIITTASDGTHSGTWASTSQHGITQISEIAIHGDTIHMSVTNWGGYWEGKLSADGSTLEGQWTQGGLTSPLVLKKVATQ